ncbi:MAG: 50S ribosomal protein L14 [Candidatus Curtissbacteria bacterium]|nr:50S ribosomal protein L14 [Candidatus Curtissbacteria bacterium]
MLIKRSKLIVADNSGAKGLYVIGMGKGTGKRFLRLGEIATCVVHGASPTGQVKDHEKVKAVIVRTRKETRRRDGSYVRFSENAAVIIDQTKAPRGTRIFGPIAQEVKEKGFAKIASLAKEVV